MNVENAVYPKREQLAALVSDQGEGPVVMLNLLRFRERAVYRDGRETSLTGRQAYDLYGAEMAPFVASRGGRVQLVGAITGMVIGRSSELWDAVALVEYPSAAAFLEIAMSPEVAAFGVHREAGLAGQLLLACRATPMASGS